jgi:hypothetical protein
MWHTQEPPAGLGDSGPGLPWLLFCCVTSGKSFLLHATQALGRSHSLSPACVWPFVASLVRVLNIKNISSRELGFMPIILATWEAEIGRLEV